MAGLRSKALLTAAAAALLLCAVAQAGMVTAKTDVTWGSVSSVDAQSGRLVVGGRALYLTPQSAIQRQVGVRYQAMSAGQLAAGQQVRVVSSFVGDHYAVRSVDVLESTSGKCLAK